MIWKKSVISCLMWAVYLFMVGAAMVFTCRGICDSLGMVKHLEYVISAAYLLVIDVMVYVLHRTAAKLDIISGREGKGLAWLERIIIFVLFVAGIFLRVMELQSESLTVPEESGT